MRNLPLRVFLIGDSIRLNIEKYVVENLDIGVHLSSPSENCESSSKVKEKLDSWLSGESFDLIYINCGLHDIRYDPGKEVPVSSKQQYIENLEGIFGRLSQLDCRVIWATSTPVDEEMHNEVKVSRRYLKDIIEYNRVSVQLAGKFGFETHDLFSKVLGQNLKEIMRTDGVHFNEAGNARIGEWVSTVINEALCDLCTMNFEQISTEQDLYRQALNLRYELFFEEFDLPRGIEKDDLEESSEHLGITKGERLLAYARLTDLGSGNYKISQVVVSPSMQHQGYGKALLEGTIQFAKTRGASSIELNSQVSAISIYSKLGFNESGGHYPSKSTGIPHVKMVLGPVT